MFSSLLSLLLVVPLIAAIPVPLEAEFVEHNAATHGAEKAKFDEALGVANTQISNMQNVLKNPNDPRIAQAFGPNANLATIQGNVNKLATKTMKVQTSDPNFADNTHGGRVNGFVPVDTGSGERVTSPAQFGSTFYSGNSEADKKFRAGTIIHEATHYLGATGDHVAPGSKIIRAGGAKPAGTVIGGGYAEAPIPNSDAAMGNRYTTLRANSPNMEHNADSYRVFAALCSRSLYKRALTQEDPVGYYLAKRQQCSLPPDYFKKKAEAKAAAAKGATATKQPAGKAAANAKAGVKGTSTAKGLKSAKTTKAGKGIKAAGAGKGVKSTRKSLTKGTKATKATKGGRAAKGTKALRAAKGVKGAKGTKGLKSPKGLKATKGTRGAKAGKAGKGTKALKGAKTGKTLRSPKAAKGTKSLKTSKGRKAVKGAKAVKGSKVGKVGKVGKAGKAGKALKGAKAVKGAKSAKALKSTRGAKASKATKGSKAGKVTKGVKTAKAGKAGKVAKAAKTPKGVKATKGKTTASRAARRKTTTSRATNKAAGKATRGNTTKATKSTASRSSQKVTQAAPRAATKAAPKAAVAAKVVVPKKAGKKN